MSIKAVPAAEGTERQTANRPENHRPKEEPEYSPDALLRQRHIK